MLSKKNLMVTMVTDEFLENRIILHKFLATIGFIWFFWFQKCILLYIFVQIFLVMRCIRSYIFFFRLGLTPTLKQSDRPNLKKAIHPEDTIFLFSFALQIKMEIASWNISYQLNEFLVTHVGFSLK